MLIHHSKIIPTLLLRATLQKTQLELKDLWSVVGMLLVGHRVTILASTLPVSNIRIQNRHSLVKEQIIKSWAINRHFLLIGKQKLLGWRSSRLVEWLNKTSTKDVQWVWAEWIYKKVCLDKDYPKILIVLNKILRIAYLSPQSIGPLTEVANFSSPAQICFLFNKIQRILKTITVKINGMSFGARIS